MTNLMFKLSLLAFIVYFVYVGVATDGSVLTQMGSFFGWFYVDVTMVIFDTTSNNIEAAEAYIDNLPREEDIFRSLVGAMWWLLSFSLLVCSILGWGVFITYIFFCCLLSLTCNANFLHPSLLTAVLQPSTGVSINHLWVTGQITTDESIKMQGEATSIATAIQQQAVAAETARHHASEIARHKEALRNYQQQ